MIAINLVPQEYIEKEKKKAATLAIAGLVSVILSAVAVYSAIKIYEKNKLADQVKGLEARIQALEEVAKQVDALEARKREIDAKNAIIGKLLAGRFDYPKMMEALVMSLPPNEIWVNSLGMKPSPGAFDLNVQSNAFGINSLIRWIQRLEESPAFSKVTLGAVNYSPTGIAFPISFTYTLPPN